MLETIGVKNSGQREMPRHAFKIFAKLAVVKGFQINLLLGFTAYQIISAEATIDVKF